MITLSLSTFVLCLEEPIRLYRHTPYNGSHKIIANV